MKDKTQLTEDPSESIKGTCSNSTLHAEHFSDHSNNTGFVVQTKSEPSKDTTQLPEKNSESPSDTCSTLNSNKNGIVVPTKRETSEDTTQSHENSSESPSKTCSTIRSEQCSDDKTQLLENPSESPKITCSTLNSEQFSDVSNKDEITSPNKSEPSEDNTQLLGNPSESPKSTCITLDDSNKDGIVCPTKSVLMEDTTQLLEKPTKSPKITCSILNSRTFPDDSNKNEITYPSKCELSEDTSHLLENPSESPKITCSSLNRGKFTDDSIKNEIVYPSKYESSEVITLLLENPSESLKDSNNGDLIYPTKSDPSNEEEGTVPDGGWGWFIVLGTTVISVLICSIQGTFGILFSRPLMDMNASSTTIFWIFSYFSVLYYLMGPLMEPLVQVLGWRVLGMVATTLVSLSFIISAFATSPYFLIFSFSIIGGIGSGLCLAITHTILPYYFKKHLGVANAFPMGSVCVGGFMLPPLIRYLLDEYTYKGTMLILAALILNATAAAALFHPPEWHKKKNDKTYHLQTLQQNIISKNATETCKEQLLNNKSDNSRNMPKTEIQFSKQLFQVLKRFCFNMKILQNNHAKIIAIGNGLYINSVINFFMFVPFYLQEEGHSLETSAWLVSISSFMNFFARMLFSVLSDRKWFNKKICFMMGLVLCIIPILGFPYTTDVVWCTILLAVFGTGFGCCFSMYSLLMVEYMGLKNLGAAYGASSLMITSGFLIIGPLLGYVLDVSGSFTVTFWILGALCIITFCLWLFMPAPVNNENNMKSIQDPLTSV